MLKKYNIYMVEASLATSSIAVKIFCVAHTNICFGSM